MYHLLRWVNLCRCEGAAARCTTLSARCAKQHAVMESMGSWYDECAELNGLLKANQETIRVLAVELAMAYSDAEGARRAAGPSQV